jgi:hypothetical protein
MTMISLGAGVQSTALALMSLSGELPPVQYIVFADTHFDPPSTYDTIEYIRHHAAGKSTVVVVDGGDIRNDIGVMPMHYQSGCGMRHRICTTKHKIQPLHKFIRETMGADWRKLRCEQWLGISADEFMRAKPSRVKYVINRFPLLEREWDRQDCINWLKANRHPVPEKSACISCPYRNRQTWEEMAKRYPDMVHDAMRLERVINEDRAAKGLPEEIYFHRALKPLDSLNLINPTASMFDDETDLFDNECDGVCGL